MWDGLVKPKRPRHAAIGDFVRSAPSDYRVVWAVALSDVEAVKLYPRLAGIVGMYRELAREARLRDDTPICHWVRGGFSFKDHVTTLGTCSSCLKQLLQKNGAPKDPRHNEDHLVFMVPKFLSAGKGKSWTEQLTMLDGLRRKLRAPSHHIVVGTASDVAIGILGCPSSTWQGLWVAWTASMLSGTERLCLGFTSIIGLTYYNWSGDGGTANCMGVFVGGREFLRSTDPQPPSSRLPPSL